MIEQREPVGPVLDRHDSGLVKMAGMHQVGCHVTRYLRAEEREGQAQGGKRCACMRMGWGAWDRGMSGKHRPEPGSERAQDSESRVNSHTSLISQL